MMGGELGMGVRVTMDDEFDPESEAEPEPEPELDSLSIAESSRIAMGSDTTTPPSSARPLIPPAMPPTDAEGLTTCCCTVSRPGVWNEEPERPRRSRNLLAGEPAAAAPRTLLSLPLRRGWWLLHAEPLLVRLCPLPLPCLWAWPWLCPWLWLWLWCPWAYPFCSIAPEIDSVGVGGCDSKYDAVRSAQ
jgi:hypothetical protein